MVETDGFSLSKSKIAIIGLGLMGGSLALALKGKCAELMAIVPNRNACKLAVEKGVVSIADELPENILPQADLIILSTPVQAILEWLERIPDYTPQNCIVMDVGSSKQPIVEAMNNLPDRFGAIGGHPICGKETLSIDYAEATLYKDAPFVLTPPAHISVRASSAALQVISAIGARPLWLDAATHDRILAYTSHLPFLLASALALSAPSDAASLVGPGFNSTSRLASTPSSMMLGVLQMNRVNILKAINNFKQNLEIMEQAINSDDWNDLEDILKKSKNMREKFL
jgi:prephenate dehydrogenase